MVDASEQPGKRRIKKLTAEKLQQFHDEIVRRDGQQVDLTGRGIESIVSLEGLHTATKLDLSHNKLTKLSQLKTVPRVTMLKLTDNKLNGDGLAEIQHLKKLVILNAAENQVTRIPFEVLRNVRTLKALVLNNNSISVLDWMPKLPELNSLILSEITELRLSHNRIKKVPAHLAQLKNLKVLELSHNQIDDWSGLEALSTLENLRQLNLIGNPICGKKLEVAAKPDKEEDESSDSDSDGEGSDDGESDSDDDKQKKNKPKSKSKKAKISEEEKLQIKEAKKLDAKHKQYNFKMKRLFPNLVVRDAARVLDKRVHGYVAPPKEEKKSKPSSKKEKKVVTGKRKRDEDKKKAKSKEESQKATPIKDDSNDAEKPPKKEKKAHKKNKSEQPATDKPAKEAATTPEPEKKKVKHPKKQSVASDSAPMDVDQTASASKTDAKTDKKAAKEKKRKDKKDKKKDQRQPKEIASGVVAVKQFKKAKKAKSAESKPVDLTQINFTPDVGFGGTSAWD
ncbi:hypothetical protein JG687_00005622 [Phytophthora cactorum]|uniref:Uncharacterized protein n=1 Tax=Phytophthora cactorum TaxID=29920 RepID=A0A8T1UQ40_9STRA|nr:hypothetical protein JG687_00005622 [Phytophthora cactorum]